MAERVNLLIRTHETEPEGETLRVIPSKGYSFEEIKLLHIKELVAGIYYHEFKWFNDLPEEEKDYQDLANNWEKYTNKYFGSPQTFQWVQREKILQDKKVPETCMLCNVYKGIVQERGRHIRERDSVIEKQNTAIEKQEENIKWLKTQVRDKSTEVEFYKGVNARLAHRADRLHEEKIEIMMANSRAAGMLKSS